MKDGFYDKLQVGVEIMQRTHPTGEFIIEGERIYIEPCGLTVFDHEQLVTNGWDWEAGPGTYSLNTSNYHDE